MTMETRPDHDVELTICGQTYLFRRTHDLLRRIEQRFGALLPLAMKVERFSATQTEIAGVYEEIVRGDPQRPLRLAIEQWVWDEGTPKVCEPLARILYELPIGNRTLRLLEEEKRIALAEQADRKAAAMGTKPGGGVRPTPPPETAAMTQEQLQAILTRAARPKVITT